MLSWKKNRRVKGNKKSKVARRQVSLVEVLEERRLLSLGTVEATFDSVAPAQQVGIHYLGAVTQLPKAGVMNLTRSSDDTAANNWDGLPERGTDFTAFCIELTQLVSKGGKYQYDVVPLMEDPRQLSPAAADGLRELWGEFRDDIDAGTDEATRNSLAAAFQLAVWEIVYDTDWDLAHGNFKATSPTAAITTAEDWLEKVQTDNYTRADLFKLVNGTDQDFLIESPQPRGGGQGLTPGFWKQSQHFYAWEPTGFKQSQLFDDVFGLSVGTNPGLTLLGALSTGGGGYNALNRHAVAALLNSVSPSVDYYYFTWEVIAWVREAYASNVDVETTKNLFAAQNELGGEIPKSSSSSAEYFDDLAQRDQIDALLKGKKK